MCPALLVVSRRNERAMACTATGEATAGGNPAPSGISCRRSGRNAVAELGADVVHKEVVVSSLRMEA